MGGQVTGAPSTIQGQGGSQLAQLFARAGGGYQQPNQVAPIAAPQYPSPLTPTPQQAAATTAAAIQQRMPMAAPSSAPRISASTKAQQQYNQQLGLGRNGSASGR